MRRRSRSSNARPSCCSSNSRKFSKNSRERENRPSGWKRRSKPRRRVIRPRRLWLPRARHRRLRRIAAETVWRQHNMVNDIGTAFATTPYPFSPLYNEHEFHGTARQSRISLLVEGNIDPYQKLSGYYESDFLGVGQTSN